MRSVDSGLTNSPTGVRKRSGADSVRSMLDERGLLFSALRISAHAAALANASTNTKAFMVLVQVPVLTLKGRNARKIRIGLEKSRQVRLEQLPE